MGVNRTMVTIRNIKAPPAVSGVSVTLVLGPCSAPFPYDSQSRVLRAMS
jgi:hypothetical protein